MAFFAIPRTLRVLLVLTPLAIQTHALAVTGDGNEIVTLRFAWPETTDARVSFSSRRAEETVGGVRDQVSLSGTYRMLAERRQGDYQIGFAEPVYHFNGANNEGIELQQFALRLAHTMPDFAVTTTGGFAGLTNVSQTRSKVREAVDELLDHLPSANRTGARDLLAKALRRASLEIGIRDDWNRKVGTWVGATLKQGEGYEAQYQAKLPGVFETAVPMRAVFRFRGRTACNHQDTKKNCILLEYRSTANFGGPQYWSAKPDSQDRPFESIEVDTSMRLTTDPNTLLPHRAHYSKTMTVTANADGSRRRLSQFEELVETFSY